MDFHQAQFLISAASAQQFPKDEGYEVAFAGRSNAGKSSAINTLTRNVHLAKTSKTPGRTQQINFFTLDTKRRLVDLPGYGFAKVPKPMQASWQNLMASYFETRQSLKGLVILMDIRHPMKELDIQLIDYALHYNIPCQLLLTKADKFSRGAGLKILAEVQQQLPKLDNIELQLFSSLKATGLNELKKKLSQWYFS